MIATNVERIIWQVIAPRAPKKLTLLPMPSPAHDPASNSTSNNPTSVNGSTTNNTPNDDSLSDDLSCSDFIEDFAKLGHHFTEADINEWLAADVDYL